MMASQPPIGQRREPRESLLTRFGFGAIMTAAALSAGVAPGGDLGLRDLEGIRLDLQGRSATLEVVDSTDPFLCLIGIKVPNALRIQGENAREGREGAMSAEDFRAIPFDRIADLREFSPLNNPFIEDQDLVGLQATTVRRVEIVGGVVDGSFLKFLPRDTVQDLGIKDVIIKTENLKELTRYHHLKILSLVNAGVDDEALKVVSEVPGLKTVVIKGPGVSIEGVLTLCDNPSIGFIGAEVIGYPTARELAKLDEFCGERPDLKVVLTVVRDEERLSLRINKFGFVAQREPL